MVETELSEPIAVMQSKPLIVVGIPAFNEEKTIAKVVLEAQKHADKVVVCDDGSTDMTGEIARRLGAEVVKHARNLGYGVAIQSIFAQARQLDADILVTLDADGQHDPSEVQAIVKPIKDGKADIVIGSRFADETTVRRMPRYRRAGVKVITKLTNGQSKHNTVEDAQSGFRAYNRKSMEVLIISEDGMGASAEILMNARKQGLKVCETPSSCTYGDSVETSTHNPISHGVGVVAAIAKLVVEDSPLTLLGIPGMLCLAAGVLFGAWMLQLYALEHRIVTNVALASIAFIMIGLFSTFTAITLYAIKRQLQKLGNGRLEG